MEARPDTSQVIPEGQRALPGPAWEPPAVRIAAAGALTALAHADDHDLSTPDHSAATARAYADDWADFSAICALHDLEALPAVPQSIALHLKAGARKAAGTEAPLPSQARP